MRRLFQNTTERLQEFVAQRDTLLLVVQCRDEDTAYVSKTIDSIDEAGQDVFFGYSEPFVDPASYADAIVRTFQQQAELLEKKLEEAGDPPWPPLPPIVGNRSSPPVKHLQTLFMYARTRIPDIEASHLVVVLCPLRVAAPHAWRALLRELIEHDIFAPWCHHMRIIAREPEAVAFDGMADEWRTALDIATWPRAAAFKVGAAPWVRWYAHTAEGYLVERQDSLRGTTRFNHDAAHRVVLEQPPRTTPLVYEHDAAGNLVRNGATQATYLPGNLIATANGRSFAHDVHQNVQSETFSNRVRRYVSDGRNQLVGVHSFRSADEAGSPWVNDALWSAQYDALNRRVAKTHGDATTRFVWDTDRLAAEIRPDGQLRVYVYADHFALTPILLVDYASVDAAPESGAVHLVFPDHLGCPNA